MEGERREGGELLFRAADIAAGRIYMLSMSKLLIPLPTSNQPTPFTPVQLSGHALPTFDTNSTFDSEAPSVARDASMLARCSSPPIDRKFEINVSEIDGFIDSSRTIVFQSCN